MQSLITCDFSVFLAYLGRFRADLGDIFSGKLQAKVSEGLVGSNLDFGISGLRNSGIQIPGFRGLAVFGCFLAVFLWFLAYLGRSWADLGDIFSGKLQARVFPVLAGSNPEFWVCGRNSGIPEFRNWAVLGCFGLFWAVFGVSLAFLGRSE